MRKSISALLPALLLTACAPPADRHPELPDGIWRAEVDHFGHILPFNFEVARDGEQLTVTYLNGPERMPVEQVRYDGSGRIELNFPSYSSRLTAKVDAGTMTGEITLLRANKTHQLPFRAEHGQSWRFFPEPADEYADFGGRWEVEIVVPRFDFKQPAIALFDQDGPYVSGTIMTQVGDYRYLYGEARGQDLYLSTFDGGGTQQWRATLDSAGELAGEFESAPPYVTD
ncbi:MAG: hypothetical protein QNJ73_12215, partial [Gammaproteobacteria bacterium]|nr:hypothetical protein [Gammaproteobacteria bacterium]